MQAGRLSFHQIGAHVAQLVEHVLGKDEVTRSIRVVGSITWMEVSMKFMF